MATSSSDDFCTRLTAYFDEQWEELKDFCIAPTNIEWLDKILSELFAINPYIYDDESLWNLIKNRRYSTHHPYHCIIVSFGEIQKKQISTKYGSTVHDIIQVNYCDTQGSKKISDFIYPLKDSNGNRIKSHIILPWSWHDVQITFYSNNINSLLENKSFLLLYSIPTKNKFNQDVNLWSLVVLKDNIRENAKIIREYILKSQLWALMNLNNAPNSFFNFNIPDNIKCNILQPIEFKCGARLSTARHWFISKQSVVIDDSPRKKQYFNNYRNAKFVNNKEDDSYLDDELDYIRQNGGDWIDD